MSEALIGVLIGGLIGWVAPLLTLRYGERRWRFETKLGHLKAERLRFEEHYETALKLFADGAATGSYSSSMIADFLVLFPAELTEIFEKHMHNEDKSEQRIRGTYLELAAAMKRDLRARDSEIREYLDAA
jgi:hypothetical protein